MPKDAPTNLPDNSDPRSGNLGLGQEAELRRSLNFGSPTQTSSPPPLPDLSLSSPFKRPFSESQDEPALRISDVKKLLEKITINGASGAFNGDQLAFNLPSGSASRGSMGVSLSQPAQDLPSVSSPFSTPSPQFPVSSFPGLASQQHKAGEVELHQADKSPQSPLASPSSAHNNDHGNYQSRDGAKSAPKEDFKLQHTTTPSFSERQESEKLEDDAREERLSGKTKEFTPEDIGKLAKGDKDASPERNLLDSRRHNNESAQQYRDRQAVASQYRSASYDKKKEMLDAYISSTGGDSYLPVLLTRADGRQKTLGLLLSATNIKSTGGLRKDISEYYDPSTHPFKVHINYKDNNATSPLQAGVVYYSHLYRSVDPTDKIPINGLLSLPSDINPDGQDLSFSKGGALKADVGNPNGPSSPIQFGYNDTKPTKNPAVSGGGGQQIGTRSTHANTLGWIDINDDDYVWLELTITGGTVSAAKIQTNKKGESTYNPSAAPGEPGSIVQYNGGSQTKSRVILGKMAGRVFEQYVTSNLYVVTIPIAGKSAIYACPSPGGGGGETTSKPFDVILGGAGTPDPETGKYSSYIATIIPGTVNGILPSNLFNTFEISGNSIKYFTAKAVTDGKKVTSVSIELSSLQPQAQAPVAFALPASFDKLFAVYTGGQVHRVIGPDSITVNPRPLFTTDRANPTPGGFPYETYYDWGV